MTTEDLAKLTSEEKRIRIAELHGWKRGSDLTHEERTHFNHPTYDTAYFQKTPSGWEIKPAPDYLNDLNAMHRAVLILRANGKGDEYFVNLREILKAESFTGTEEPSDIDFAEATAAQRADAFLLTLG